MNYGIFFRYIILVPLAFFIILLPTHLVAQSSHNSYVVIGAFMEEDNARQWVDHADELGLEPQYEKNQNRGLFYVYVLSTPSVAEASNKLNELEGFDEFSDAWIYTGPLSTQSAVVNTFPEVNEAVEEETEVPEEELIEEIVTDEPIVASTSESEKFLQIKEEKPEKPLTRDELREEVYSYDYVEEERDEELGLGGLTVFFNLYNQQNSQDVTGDVQVIDVERSKLVQEAKSGDFINVPDPNNGSGKLTIIAEVFGFRKLQHNINFYQPMADTASKFAELIGDVLVYNFPLVRYHKGDIYTMFHVYFFRDAAMMIPESKFEVDNLLQMMKENENYKIKIHGHTNGKSAGKIILPGEDNNYFALTDDDVEKFGSAKKLSEERATIIKNYLIQNGIDPERMEVKAWGGKRMLYDKFSNQAKKNVRVEIEILEE